MDPCPVRVFTMALCTHSILRALLAPSGCEGSPLLEKDPIRKRIMQMVGLLGSQHGLQPDPAFPNVNAEKVKYFSSSL